MRLLLILTLSATSLALAACASYSGYKVYRLIPTGEQLDLLREFEGKPGFDFWSSGRVANVSVDIMVAPDSQTSFESFLDANGIAFHVRINDVQTVFGGEKKRQELAPQRKHGEIEFNQYYKHPEINAYLDEMAEAYPNVASVVTIGQSTEGRDLKVLKISRGGNNPVIWIDAGIHAREWIAPAMALYVINQLLQNPANSALLDGVDWHILPVVNPDGYQWTHTDNRMWRKTRSKATSTECPGVDANRNFGYHWGGDGADAFPCSRFYRGPKAFSEPETAAIRDHLLANAARTKFYLSLHSHGGCFIYPWAWTKTLVDNAEELDELARKADAAQTEAGGSPYKIGPVSHAMYFASGSSLDWTKGVANISLSYVVELPGYNNQGFDVPADKILEVVSQFFPAVAVFGEHIRGNE